MQDIGMDSATLLGSLNALTSRRLGRAIRPLTLSRLTSPGEKMVRLCVDWRGKH